MEGEKKKTVKKVASKKVMKDKQKSLYGVNARKEEKKTTKNKFETLKENVNPQGNIDKTKTDNKDLLLNALNTINKNLDSKNNEKIINNLQKKLKEQETTINSLYGDLHQEGQENQENSRLLEEANIINNDLGKELKELRKKKISPLTDCFNETREKFYNEERLWFNFIICTFMGAFILIIFMLIPSSNFNNKLDYFLQIFPIMALTLSFLYFILIQYNKAKNLRIE